MPAGLACVKKLSSSDAWHAAKQLFSEKAVEVYAVSLDAGKQLVYVQGSVATLNVNAAAFPHCHPPASPAAAESAISVQLCLQSESGELLDATCSCCPGGANIVLGSICPCAAAVLLTAAKQANPPAACGLIILVSSNVILLLLQQGMDVSMHEPGVCRNTHGTGLVLILDCTMLSYPDLQVSGKLLPAVMMTNTQWMNSLLSLCMLDVLLCARNTSVKCLASDNYK